MNEELRRASWTAWLESSMNLLDPVHGHPWWRGVPSELCEAALWAAIELDIANGSPLPDAARFFHELS